MSGGPVLALDTSSPIVSVAIADGDRVLAERTGGQRESSAHLLAWVDEVLAAAGLRLGDLAGLVALAGPGSFTGLRVGLASALGLHQAVGLQATALPTFAVLAAVIPPATAPRALAVVPALPGEWYAQVWATRWPPTPTDEAQRLPTAGLGELAGAAGATAVVGPPGSDLATVATSCSLPAQAAGPLAATAALLACAHPPFWDPSTLSAPLYLAPPPVTPATAPKRVLPLELPAKDTGTRRR